MSKTGVSPHTASDSGAVASGSVPGESDKQLKDASIINWDGPQDVADPQNWTDRKKWAHVIMVSLFALVTSLVPSIGGFTAGGLGWRWTFWLLAILSGTIHITAAVLMRETHPGILLERKAANLRASTGNHDLRSRMTQTRLTPGQVLIAALIRPSGLLLHSPILFVISVYVALVFGTMYLLFTTFTDVFEGQYGLSTTVSGLTYLGLGVALVAAMVTSRAIGDRVQQSRMRADGVDIPKPEYRLVLMIIFSPFMPAQLYLVDLFGSQAAASALGANNLLRFLFSTFLPLAGPPMYKALGYSWGHTLLGFLALAFVPFPLLFYKYGERLRTKSVNL
ncbi:hypothetical protein VPNG_03346 [Cytospora leucostoma]|uniref:Major facilitator superfamily (MFS) profile domain-containing protein n=1 Tax=Cytospora leucostoma TaxID=1230097 RepID=A0A423XFF5_9PEZI|nr:hypothetical protein VPNG_03346 [Cytospora leucostoma]